MIQVSFGISSIRSFPELAADRGVGAFAVASLLSMLAIVTLIIKTLVERSGYRRR